MGPSLKLLHLSDLHFGRIQDDVLTDLEAFIRSRESELQLAVLTGDLTQRARSHEFRQAYEFLSTLNCPLFLVPGNHDVPLYNLFLRFLTPYRKFRRYMGPLATNFYEDDRCAVYGLWTTDNFTVKTGKIALRDLREAEKRLSGVAAHKIRIIASHHPLTDIRHPRLKDDLKRLMDLGPHFFLWGHAHQSDISVLAEGKSYVLASGTSTSSRTREEANSFNVITVDGKKACVEVFQHSQETRSFQCIKKQEVLFD